MNTHELFSDSFHAMNTLCDVVFTKITRKKGRKIFGKLKNEIKQLENRLNSSGPHSPLAEIKRKAPDWIHIPDDIWEILTICFDFYQFSNGAFDITVGPILDLWMQTPQNETPTHEEIKEAREITGFDKIEFDFQNQKLKFKTDGLRIDFGGIQKGIALDRAKQFLQREGIENAIVSFGEHNVLALGRNPAGQPWPVGIRNVNKMKEFVHFFSVSNQTVITSDALLNRGGKLHKSGKIIDPVTGRPVAGNKIISVKSESGAMAEFLSKVWLILPENDKSLLSEKMKQIEILEVEYLNEVDFNTRLTIL